MLVGWQKRGLIGRRESLAECATSAAMRSSFPPDELHLHVLGNGIKRHASLPSARWPLPSTKGTNIFCSRLATCPRSCVLSLRGSFCLEHPLTPLSACFTSSQSSLLFCTPSRHTTPPPLASILYMHHAKLSPYHVQATPARLVLLQA